MFAGSRGELSAGVWHIRTPPWLWASRMHQQLTEGTAASAQTLPGLGTGDLGAGRDWAQWRHLGEAQW